MSSKPPQKAPPVLLPVVSSSNTSIGYSISDRQFSELESVGDIRLTEPLRRRLITVAIFWIGDLEIRQSARPKRFQRIFETMQKAFRLAEAECAWDHGDRRHLAHWAMETSIKDSVSFPVLLTALGRNLKSMREMILTLEGMLPPDPGRQRPFDDERRIINLADIFEEAGGKAVVYAGGYYNEESTADTAFRRFAQTFYALLPVREKRARGGFDDALRDALRARRARGSGVD